MQFVCEMKICISYCISYNVPDAQVLLEIFSMKVENFHYVKKECRK